MESRCAIFLYMQIKLVIIPFIFLILLFSLIQCTEPPDTAPPEFSVTPVIMEDFDAGTNRCGDVKDVIPFGGELDPTRKSPAIEYYTVADAVVRAASPGVVIEIFQNPGLTDYEIMVKPTEDSVWLIIYDHVLDVTISVGDNVEAGTILGKAGEWSADTRRTELQINNYEGTEVSLCPLQFGTDNFNQKHIQLFQDVYNNDLDPDYLTSGDVCLEETVIP
jgi:hypothetical protein